MNFEDHLAPYAVRSALSAGRVHSEISASSRTEFQRDRDRIIHSSAFRRLEYKTQVFVNHEGDLFRTRLTHSLEVAQIARSIARTMQLNEDLVEAISLAHDVGHTPFGHAGQDALHDRMKEYDGFEHNLQSLRVVDVLEERYAAFDGLNLMFETREGILKHCSVEHAKNLGEVGRRFLDKKQPSLEAQLVNLADEIAYSNHDIDDGLRSGLLSVKQLEEISVYGRHRQQVMKMYPGIVERRVIFETMRRMIGSFAEDVIATSQGLISGASVKTVDEVRLAEPLIRFSSAMRIEMNELQKFLRDNLYRHYQVNRMSSKAHRIVTTLFDTFFSDPGLLPEGYQLSLVQRTTFPELQARKISDYLAGMTDRYAMREYRRLFMVDEV